MVSTTDATKCCVSGPSLLLLGAFWAVTASHVAVAAQNGFCGEWEELLTWHIVTPAILTLWLHYCLLQM